MAEKKKWLRLLKWSGFLLLVLLAVLVLAPKLIRTEGFKGEIQTLFRDKMGGQLDYLSTEIIFFPRPGIDIEQLQITLPGRLDGRISGVRIYPQLLPLLHGEVRLADLELTGPELSLVVPDETKSGRDDQAPASVANLPAALAPVIDRLAGEVPELDVSLNQGHIRLSRQGQPWLELQRVELELSLEAAVAGTAAADLNCSIGELWLQQGAKKIQLKDVAVDAAANFKNGDLKVSLVRLGLAQPALQLSGELLVESAKPAVSLKLQGQEVDVDATRKLALTLAGKNDVVENVFSYLRGGTVEAISFSSHGKNFAELGDLQQIKIQGRLKEGAISISAIDMDLKAVNGEVTIAAGILEGTDLSARLDDSTGRDGQLKIDLTDISGPFHLDLQVDAELKQVHTIIARLVQHAEFAEELKRVAHIQGRGQGRLVLGDSIDNLAARVEVKKLDFSAEYQRLPFPVSVQQGQLSFAANHISLTGLAGKVGTSNFSDVTFQLDWKEHFSLAATSGTFLLNVEKSHPWLQSFPALKGPLSWLHQPAGEFQFVTSGLHWQPDTGFAVKGKLVFPQGPEVTADISSTPERIEVRQLDIRDQGAQASLAFSLQQRELELRFSGKLQQKTLYRMFLTADSGEGLLQGDFKLKAALGKIEESTTTGELKAESIRLPAVLDEPFIIRKLDLSATEKLMIVKTADLTWGANEVGLNGRVDLTPSGLLLDLDAAAGALVWAPAVQSEDDLPPSSGQQNSWLPEISGNIRLKAKSFTLKGLTWEPLQANITLKPEQTDIRIDRAELCGISSPGTLVVKGKQFDLDFQISAKGQEIAPRYACLTNNRVQMTGTFDLDGRVTADGTADTLLQNAKGRFVAQAHDGQITQDKTLARTLEVVNLSQLVKGKLPDLKTEGLDYKSMSVEVELKGEKLLLKKYQMDGTTLDLLGQGEVDLGSKRIDAQLMAAPFTTIDSVIKHIPGVSYLMAGSLIAIPVSIQGDLNDPKVKILAPSAVGSGLLGLAERVVKAPVKLFESALPDEKKP